MLWVLLRPTRTQPRPRGQSQGKAPWGRGWQEPNKFSSCETGPTVFRPYPRREESLTVCPFADVLMVKALFYQSFKDRECWSGQGLNPRPPVQQTGALPTELTSWSSVWKLWWHRWTNQLTCQKSSWFKSRLLNLDNEFSFEALTQCLESWGSNPVGKCHLSYSSLRLSINTTNLCVSAWRVWLKAI